MDDPHQWLEDVTGEQALDWVRARNATATATLTDSERAEGIRAEVREVLDAEDRIPYVRRRGEYLYNFWRDARHPRGLWRRTTLEQYRTEAPRWEVLIDVDALAEREDENWVWQGATVLRPEYRRCLVELSRGGADASVVREFDMDTLEFVRDGFRLPEAKSTVSWIDAERIYVGTDFGEGSLTNSGYPRIVKEWRRGTDLAEAPVVYEAKPEDVAASGFRDLTEGFERDFVQRALDFYRTETYLRTSSDELILIDVPLDAEIDVHREWLLIELRSTWHVAGAEYSPGTLLATGFDAYLAGAREFTVLFEPDANTSLNDRRWTRNHVLLSILSDVQSRILVCTPGRHGWSTEPIGGVAEHRSAEIIGTDPDGSDEYLLNVSGFTDPAELRYGHVGGSSETLKRAPELFDASALSVRQYFATSADGTTVPYFVTGPDPASGPALLTGYGGFELSLTPTYNGVIGRGWLQRGGTYVVANIRGGGEYGPGWHAGAIKSNRMRAYEDFAAVAADLVERGITTADRLGIQGGSNGGLLTGVMLTRYPERFGAVVSQVPLLDMRRYHLLLAGASWMAEYGNPDDDSEWAYIREYSPYHNIRAGQGYPPALFVTSTRDDRVHPAHARKMVAALREIGCDVSYYENIEGGHGAAADNEQLAFKWSLVFEFLWRKLAR